MTNIIELKIELLNLTTAYATAFTCEKAVEYLGQLELGLRKEILSPCIDAIAFSEQADNYMYQFRQDELKVKATR